jgi:hypothetical protein
MQIKGPEALCQGYGQAMDSKDGKMLAGYYLFPYISFTSGHVHRFEDRAIADESCEGQVRRFERAGIGSDIRLVDYKVVPVSEGSALCHLTWAVFPKNGMESWTWLNIYGYRRRDEEEGFEFNISDNEIEELLKRVPNFFSL